MTELPLRLINSWRLFFKYGWLEIGLHPENKSDGSIDFCVLVLVTIGKSYIKLNEEEVANFFMYLREKEKFSNVGTAEEYFSDVKDGFFGAFWMEELRDERYIIYFSDENGGFENVGPLHERDLKYILENEHKINDQIREIKLQKNDIIYELESIARECDGNVEKIHVFNSRIPILQLEMSTNHLTFFKAFINSLYSD